MCNAVKTEGIMGNAVKTGSWVMRCRQGSQLCSYYTGKIISNMLNQAEDGLKPPKSINSRLLFIYFTCISGM